MDLAASLAGHYADRNGRSVTVTIAPPGLIQGMRYYDIVYSKHGAVTKERAHLPEHTVDDLKSLEGWRKFERVA